MAHHQTSRREGGRGPLARLFGQHGQRYVSNNELQDVQATALRHLGWCRTAVLGGHLHACTDCGSEVPVYNSCRNRHCPTCQSGRQQAWVQTRTERMLPVPHFHVVFTLPKQVRGLARSHPRVLYDLLLRAAAETLQTLAANELGCQLAITEVLHTWTRELLLHPHVHCLVSAGGLSPDGERWVSRERFLFSHKVLGRVFRGIVMRELIAARDAGRLPRDRADTTVMRLARAVRKEWVVFVDAPRSRDPIALLRYLGAYVQRVAISDRRVVRVDDRSITFRTRDGAQCTLPIDTFLERFVLHVLPKGFRKVRHYGLMAPGAGRRRAQAEALLRPPPAEEGAEERVEEPGETEPGAEALRCPHCGVGALVLLYPLEPAGMAWVTSPWEDTS